ncbi:hypothetical protein GCK72_023753 [Caenorhabditis remanei]|uniref:CUB domain-containing protein n=1 Tax=Caenorhabditis remanei TaxID=31234 RepID=A0A6A5FY13_CAERE|nr:hypothetical protein GCK72_023753 [Caenorhabditis remanei]KAF1747291.1 hypothetical protein GCK72_023753 [Caenorhabditis remanei]
MDISVIRKTTNETIYLKRFSNLRTKQFLVEQNEGLLVNYTNCNSNEAPEFEYQYTVLGHRICGPILKRVGYEQKIIQQIREVSRSGNCSYHLIPSNAENIGMETLFISSTPKKTIEVTIDDDEKNIQRGELIVVRNWTSVDLLNSFEVESSARGGSKTLEEIVAISTTSSCSCDISRITLFPEEMVELHTPGFPDFLCPSARCETLILLSERNETEEFEQRVLVRVDAVAWNTSELRLSSGTQEILFNEKTFSRLSTNFLLDYQNVKVTYTTTQDFRVGTEGQFAVQVMNVKIRKACDCSLFGQKKFVEDWSQKISIPSDCEVMFCDWIISASAKKRPREITIQIDNAHDEDQMFIWNSKIMEKYPSDYLDQPRKVYINDSSSDTHIFFRRNSSGPTSIVNVSWKTLHDVDCETFTKISLTKNPKAFISPNYPMGYAHWGSCTLLLTAPKNYYITVFINELELEAAHYIGFWDGTSSGAPKLAKFTGTEYNREFSSTGNNVFVEFISYGRSKKRGYHYIAYAVRSPNATEEMETFEETTTDSPLSTTEKPVPPSLFVESVVMVLAEEIVKDVCNMCLFFWNLAFYVIVIVPIGLAVFFFGRVIVKKFNRPIPFSLEWPSFLKKKSRSSDMEMLIR